MVTRVKIENRYNKLQRENRTQCEFHGERIENGDCALCEMTIQRIPLWELIVVFLGVLITYLLVGIALLTLILLVLWCYGVRI